MSKDRILILDVDGVLNICAGKTEDLTFSRIQMHMEPELIQRFNDYLAQNNVKIIISSSWRDDMDDLQKQMEKAGFKYWNRVQGRTDLGSDSRGKQIAKVIKSRGIKDYVIIDDYVNNIIDCECVDSKRIVQTSPYRGMSVDNIQKIKDIFS